MGHRVALVAGTGSRKPGRLFTHAAPDNSSLVSRAYRKILFQPLSIRAALRADVVHNFGRVDYLWSLLRTNIPIVHTFENPIAQYEVDILLRRQTRLTMVSVSEHQRREFAGRGNWETVHNAVDVTRLCFAPTPSHSPYLAFLGRLTRNKGVHLAIAVARKSGIPLKIAGNISSEPGGQEYFEHEVRPELHGDVQWVGELNDREKVPFLGGALALLFPIQWNEPFAVVVGEALACGTPVIALKRASTPEAICHGKTGFLCESIEEMVRAVGRIRTIDRRDCRIDAENRLAASVMAERYVSIYRRTAGLP